MKNETARREIESLDYYLQNHTNDYSEKSHTAMMMAIYALELEPCGKDINVPATDVISRQAAIDAIWDGINMDIYTREVKECLEALPSVTPQQKVGRWIRVDKDKLKCSECEVIHFIAQYPQSANINYCPNCGCRMKGEDE